MKTLKSNLLFLALLLGLATQMQADVRSGLLSYYSFDSSATADSVSMNDFTEVNAPTLGVGQRGTTALQLSGPAQQYLRFDHDADNLATGFPVTGAGAYTIAMWVKGPAQTAKYLFTEANQVNAAGANQLLLLQTGNTAANNAKFDVLIRNSAATPVNHIVSTAVVFDDTWHHVAWVDDNGTAKIYVDGVLDTNINYTPAGTLVLDRASIGSLVRNTGISTGNTFNGSIDDLALWERALTEAEIQEVMNNGFPTPAGLPAVITEQPASITRASGQTALFSVEAIGPRPFTFIWKTNSVIIPEAIGNTYQIDSVTPAESGTTVSVTVSNVYGGVISETAVLTVDDAPEITEQPQGVTVTEGQTITLSVTVIGLEPFTYEWTKGGLPVGGNENPLVINNAQFSDAGDYRVNVSNGSGNDLSDIAVVVVDPRLAPPATMAIDFNHRANNTPDLTQAGFVPFTLDGAGAITTPTTRLLYDSIDVTVIGSTSSIDTRLRGTPVNTNDFTESLLLRDFVFAAANGAGNGLDVQFEYLKPNQNYLVTVWCFDQANSGNRESDWFANGALAKQGYTFSGNALPTNNLQYQFTFVAQATAAGELLIQGRQAATANGVSVFLNAIRLVETEQGALPPTFTTEPQSVSTYVDADVTFSTAASGTLPFTYVWTKGGQTIPGENGPILKIENVQFDDAADYRLIISNTGGSATSAVATLTVDIRPSTPSTVRIDVNNSGNETEVDTEDGFESFALQSIATGPTTRTLPSGIEMTLGAAGPIAIESRIRTVPTNQVDFTQEKLLRDFVFSRDTNTTQGIDIELAYLKPGQEYQVTIWSYDNLSVGNPRISDWTANGELVREGYSFIGGGANDPTSNEQYSFSFTVAADSEGKMLIQARMNAAAVGGLNCFINALQLVESTGLRITDIAVNGNVQLTIESPSPTLPHRIEQISEIGSTNWTEVPGVTFSGPVGNVLQAQFAVPDGNRFYRAAFVPPAALFEDDFEGTDKGWTSGGVGTPPWEKGTPAPSQGPGATHSGTNLWAVGLTTSYSTDSDLWLRSPTIDLTGVANATLEFWEFRSVDDLFGGSFFHYTAVRIKDAVTGDLIVEIAKDAGKQTQWTKRSLSLPTEALGKPVIIEFQLVSDSVAAPVDRHGWFVDDVTVLPQ